MCHQCVEWRAFEYFVYINQLTAVQLCHILCGVCWEEDASLSGRVQRSYLSPLKRDGSLLCVSH